MAAEYLNRSYAPDRVAEATGIPAETIRRIAAELAHAAFEQQIEIEIPGRTGRDGATTASSDARSRCMRCAASRPMPTAFRPAAPFISFRCCWARSIVRAASATNRPSAARFRRSKSRSAARDRYSHWPGRRSVSRWGRGSADRRCGKARRIDKAYSWEAPIAAMA